MTPAVRLGQGEFLDNFHARVVTNADDMGGSDLFQLAEKSVFKPVVAIGDDDFALLDEVTQRLAFAGISRRDESIAGPLAQHGELQMQFGGAVLIVEPESPVHARQGGQ